MSDEGTSDGASRRPVGDRGRVAILRGCVQAGLFARVNDATERVLRANGYEVIELRRTGLLWCSAHPRGRCGGGSRTGASQHSGSGIGGGRLRCGERGRVWRRSQGSTAVFSRPMRNTGKPPRP